MGWSGDGRWRLAATLLAGALVLGGCAASRDAPIENRVARVNPSTQPVARPGLGERPGKAPLSTTPDAGAASEADSAMGARRSSETGAAMQSQPILGGGGIKATPLVMEPIGVPPRVSAPAVPPGGSTSGVAAGAASPSSVAPNSSVTAASVAPSSSVPPQPSLAAAGAAAPKPSGRGAAAEASDPGWVWPAAGRVLQAFEAGKTKGITLTGSLGDPVVAVGDGKVIFSGQGPRGYGNLIIVKHPADLLSVYAHNRALLVKEGASVVKGQRIAELGDTDTDRPKLGFEVRRQGRPVDPVQVLPAR